MFKRFLFLIISATMIVALYGCCSHSKDGFFVNPQNDEIITSREVIIDDLGRLPTVTFPSGAKIEGLEENTLTPGIVVTIIERRFTARNTAYFNKNLNAGVYIYKITAVQNPETPIDSKTYVTTTEKPIKVTLPNANGSQGITLAGIKESDTDPWRLFNYSDTLGILSDIEDLRASKAITDNSFNIFRLGIQFALIIYEGNTGNRLPESYVSGLNASSTASIMVKDGKYLEDLAVKGILKGINLESIKPTDLRARITYRNNKSDEAPLKLNGAAVTQTNKADKTVPGYTYHHTFVVDRVSDSLLMNTSGEYTFILNLSGVETDFFSDGFLIEFFNKVDSEKILPYNYTEFYSVNKVESAELVLSSVDGSLADESGNLFILNPMFKITSSYEFSEADKKKIAEAIKISNVDSEKIKKGWEGRDLFISFEEELQPDTLYTISMEEITDLENAVITPFEEFSFTTQSDVPVIQIEFYNIDYMLYGGLTEPENPKTYSNASETFTLVNPTKSGYSFIGWTGSNGDTPQMTVIIEKGSTGDRNYTANYAAVAYSITYNLDGGVNSPENPNGFNTASETFILHEPTKLGYTFIGWTGSNGDTPQMNVSIETGSTENRTYTANFSLTSYSITYNAIDGCNFANENPVNYDITSATINITNPTKLGYEFIGWTGSNGNTPQKNLSIETGSTENRIYTANFAPTSYSITFNNIENCTFVTANPVSYDITSATININNPTREGYSFAGWTGTGLDAASMTLSIPQGSTENRTYTANFTPTSYSITYNNIENCTFAIANPENYDITSATITLNPPTRTGYEFLGWTSADIAVPQIDGVQITQGSTGDKAFTANWNLNLNLAVAVDDDMIIDNVNNLYYTKSTFTITPDIPAGLVLTASEKANIVGALSVKDSASNSVNIATASWNNEGKIALSFTSDLNASSSFSIAFGDAEGMTLNCATYTFKTFYYKGRGVNENRFQVENAAQLDYVRNYLDKHFVQTADIDIATYSWIPIGYVKSGLVYNEHSLTGSYYGNGKKIKNLKIRNSDDWYHAGLFYGVEKNVLDANSGKIASVTIDAFSIRGSDTDLDEPFFASLGIIVCYVNENCSVEYCKVTDSLNTGSTVVWWDEDMRDFGGICSKCAANASIKNCSVENSTFIGKDRGISGIGGICGDNWGSIEDCNVSNLTINSLICGGISAYNSGTISQCSVSDSTFGASDSWGDIGGIVVSQYNGTVSQCQVSKSTLGATGDYSTIGGICSRTKTDITGCYLLETTLRANGADCKIGGICSDYYDNPSISNCYLTDCNIEITGSGNSCVIGGILSYFHCSSNVTNCHVTGTSFTLNGGDSCKMGGICGFLDSGSISNCYLSDSTLSLTGGANCILGGISGESCGVSNCYISSSTVQANFGEYSYIGGIVGWVDGLLSQNYVSESLVEATGGSGSNVGGIVGYTENYNISQSYILKTAVKFTSSSAEIHVGGIVGYTYQEVSECHVSESTIETAGCEDYSGIGGIAGYCTSNNGLVSKCYLLNSSVKAKGNYNFIGGLVGCNTNITESYIANSSIEAEDCRFCEIGGIFGETGGDVTKCYVLNTNIQSTGSGYLDYIGGIGGNITGSYNLSSCYFYYDKDDEPPIKKASNDNPFGLFFGYNDFSVSDCFTNKTGTLVGESYNLTETNCYQGIDTYDKFTTDGVSPRAWTDGAWDAYKVGADKPWPLDLNELPR